MYIKVLHIEASSETIYNTEKIHTYMYMHYVNNMLIGVHEMHGQVHLNQCHVTIYTYDHFSSSGYPKYNPPPVTHNSTIIQRYRTYSNGTYDPI